MSLGEELATRPACKVCAYLGDLAPSEAAQWAAYLTRPVQEIGNTRVVSALAKRGVAVTETSVRRHRAKHV